GEADEPRIDVGQLARRVGDREGGDVGGRAARAGLDLHERRDSTGRLAGVRERIDIRAMTALSGGHLAVDFAGGALFVLIPYLHDKFHLSYTLSAVLVLSAAISGSIVQPL